MLNKIDTDKSRINTKRAKYMKGSSKTTIIQIDDSKESLSLFNKTQNMKFQSLKVNKANKTLDLIGISHYQSQK